MIDLMQKVFHSVSAFNGEGLYLTLYFLALIYLFLSEKEKGKRAVLCYVAAAIWGIIYFPLTAYLVMNKLMDEEIFYRQIWLVPCGAVTCYAATRLIMGIGNRCKKKVWQIVSKIALTLGILAVFVLSGKWAFSSENYVKAENNYHIPQYVIDVCDTIRVTDYSPNVAFPASMVQFIRQYTTQFRTPYGRDAVVQRWVEKFNMGNPLLDLIEAESYDAQEICTLASEQQIDVFIVYGYREMQGDVEEFGYTLYATVDGYDIYSIRWLTDFFEGTD